MTDHKPIPRAELKAARRHLCRMIASCIVQAMAQSDISFTEMAIRIGRREKTVRGWLRRLIEGRCKGVTLSHVSDMMFACDGAVLRMELKPRTENPSPGE